METNSIGSMLPSWDKATIKANEYKISDTDIERQHKAEQKAGGLPDQTYFQSLPDHTIGPVTYAEQIGKAAREAVNQQIAANNEEARQRRAGHKNNIHLIA